MILLGQATHTVNPIGMCALVHAAPVVGVTILRRHVKIQLEILICRLNIDF